jgi:prepilin-type N-terminal cleavage/methylation domain-containing protein
MTHLRMSRNRDKLGRMICHVKHQSRTVAGFTLVEVLVVIGIISLLMGILLPALSSVRTTGRQTVELNAARQLMVAYAAYANTNNQRVLTGDPQGMNFRAYDQAGQPLGGGILDIAKRRYPWRLAPYMNYEFRGLYNNMHMDVLEKLELDPLYKYKVAMFPSLGLNAQWIGGDFSSTGFASNDPESILLQTYGRFWVSSISGAFHPDRLIVFASARGSDAMVSGGSTLEGYFKVESPRFSAIQDVRWADRYTPGLLPSEYGYLSPRYFGEAVTAQLDGSIGTLNTDELRDMRRWANRATSEDWALQPRTLNP